MWRNIQGYQPRLQEGFQSKKRVSIKNLYRSTRTECVCVDRLQKVHLTIRFFDHVGIVMLVTRSGTETHAVEHSPDTKKDDDV